MENNLTERTEQVVVGEVVAVEPNTSTNVAPLNVYAALKTYSEEEQKEILALADSIDVRQLDKVMNYGSVPLKNSFDQCGVLLKKEKGSEADQKVMAQVVELAKKASDSYEDFNIELKEPNFLVGFFKKFFNGKKHSEKIKKRAITTYKLLTELYSSYDLWIKILQEGLGDIEDSAMSDVDSTALLEKYIIAGEIAKDRTKQELEEIQSEYEKTGLQKYIQDHDEIKEGLDIFCISMSNLEKSRVTNIISLGQLALIKRSNINAQVSINVQKQNTMTSISQQIRNAVMNEKTNEVVNGQKAISRLHDELLQEVSRNVGHTAEETEKLMYSGFLDMKVAKATVEIILESCKKVEAIVDTMLPQMEESTNEVNALLEQLRPCVESIERRKDDTLKVGNTPAKISGEKLEF